ncbi:UNVERIFIED_CONTAM: hypothetical protein RMT77_010603 [Armadillidium vulgare]
MGNRRKGDVWKYFRKVSQNAQGKAKVSCTFCGCTYLENATRMNTHLQKCSGYRKIHAIFSPENDQPGPSSYMAGQDALNYSNSFQNGIMRHSFVDHLPQQPQDNDARELLSRAIFASGFPLEMVEDPFWKSVFKSLSPGFSPPSASQLRASYLETEFCNLKDKIDKKLYECQCVGIICESVKNEDSLNILVTTPKCYFYKSFPKPSMDCLKDVSLNIIENILQNIGSEKIISIVANRSTGILESAKYVEEKYSHIAVYHCLHEAVERFLKDVITFYEDKTKIWRDFEELKSLLREASDDVTLLSNSVIYYVLSRRSYDFSLLFYMLTSKSVIIDFLFRKDCKADRNSSENFAADREFWVNVEKLYQLVEPITNMLNDFETKSPPVISHVIHIYKQFQAHIESISSDPHYSPADRSNLLSITKEFKETLIHPIHLAADLLDPQSKGASLSLNEQMMATEYIYKLAVFSKDINDEDLLVDLANYKACDELWGKEYIWKAVHKLHPVSWWNGFCSSTNLAKIAVRVFNLPSTTRYQNSMFSSYDSYPEQSTPTTANLPKIKDMLVYVSKNLKFMKEDLATVAVNEDPPFRRLPQNTETQQCIPKQEKDQHHYENEGFENYKYG